MTVAMANAYAIAVSEKAHADWEAGRVERSGPDDAAVARQSQTLGRLAQFGLARPRVN
jgi:hypothetical protein